MVKYIMVYLKDVMRDFEIKRGKIEIWGGTQKLHTFRCHGFLKRGMLARVRRGQPLPQVLSKFENFAKYFKYLNFYEKSSKIINFFTLPLEQFPIFFYEIEN